MNTQPSSVLVVDAHPMMRSALCAVITDEPGLVMSSQVSNGVDAMQVAGTIHPDIILFSLGNPGWHDLMFLRSLRLIAPSASILVLTSNEVQHQEKMALEYGASAVLTKAAERAELLEALRKLKVTADK